MKVVTIDLPVMAKVYKWTVDFYHQSVGANDHLPAELLTHVIGDPASYPTKYELETSMAGTQYWQDDEFQSVGKAGASNSASILFAEENVSQTEVTVFAELETEFKAGGATVGGSVGIEHGHSYSISYGTETEYSGSVGDISGDEDYLNWRYDWGLVVQNYGMTNNNGQISYLPGIAPFQVIRYWVDPTGPGYQD